MRDLIRRFPAILLGLGLSVGASGAFATTVPNLVEVPYLKPAVKAGKIPPIEERVPEDVDVFDMKAWGKMPGKYGGQLKFLMGKQKDTKMMMVYGYARLIAYDPKLNFVPDILKRFEVKEQREFTFYLRKGHKWSDGHPFTSEDFRYYWE
ncbi:MAG: ABC transporter substrate-binding protein, partial [Pseudomonadota bacterium]|nr:ABC transporter substrate-binding protein [Pseudomonadota bacterium]